MSFGVGHRPESAPTWPKPAAAAPIQLLAPELPYAASAAQNSKKKKKKKELSTPKQISEVRLWFPLYMYYGFTGKILLELTKKLKKRYGNCRAVRLG